MDISQIQVAIAHPDVRVVSLDIFDTLVERPAVFPTDIFFLLNDIASQIAGRRHFDFSSSRPACERRALRLKTRDNQHHQEITFKEIYDQLARTHGLSEEQRQRLSQAEQDLEMRLLAVREPGRALYHAAVTAGKKVICISDMYYGTDFLRQILAQHGYSDVAELYVSSEINKRKDSGQLFEHVLKMEGLQPHQLLHIGDNPLSDFKVPLSLGIPAYHLPSSRDLFRSSPFAKEGLWRHVACLPKADRIVIGYFINRWADRQGNASVLFPQKSDFGYFGVGPLLFSVAQYLLSHREIQSLYPCIHFASRDGYLPQQAYDLLREEFKHTADSRYVHCGRSLYQVADYDGDLQGFLFKRLRSPFAATFTIGNLFDSLTDPSILPPSDPRRNMRVGEDSEAGYRTIREITRQHRSSIEQAIRKKQQLAQMYYRSAMNFTDTRRALIFDCGYSGSISTAIGSLTGMIVDKAYIWEDRRRNRCRDHRNRSRTFLLGHSVGKSPREGFWLAAEELFAPAEPACRGFERNDGRLEPLFDSEETFSTEMKNDLATIQGSALQFVGDLRDALGPYLPFLRITNISPFMAPLLACFDSKTDPGIRHLDNIVFRDPFFGETRHLAEKLEQPHQHHFLRTPFLERSLLISRPLPALETREMAIAMHLHLFHIGQAAHIAKRLALFPLPFDLFISVPSEPLHRIASIYFAQKGLLHLRNLNIVVVPNRGRDVAPWIVTFGKPLADYDLVCHAHTKESTHFDFGTDWRDYLFDNLFSIEAVRDIVSHFHSDDALGVIFPPIFQPLARFMVRNNIPLLGRDNEESLCNDLLARMRLPFRVRRHSVLFSPGTMLWYRPRALAPLFNAGLIYDDFPPEPIGVGGSLAHAIERLPALVAESQGYLTKCYIRQDTLLDAHACSQMAQIAIRDGTLETWRCYRSAIAIFQRFFPPGSQRHAVIKNRLIQIMNRLRNNADSQMQR